MGRINFEGENKREEAAGAGAGAEEREESKPKEKKRKEKKRMGSSAAIRELQRDLENKANDLSKLQKGNKIKSLRHQSCCIDSKTLANFVYYRYCEESSSQEKVHYPAWRERACPKGRSIFFLFLGGGGLSDLGFYSCIGVGLVEWRCKCLQIDWSRTCEARLGWG